MREQPPAEGQKPSNTSITVKTGECVVMGEGITARVRGPNRDGIRTSDGRGWNAAADITDGIVEMASANGIKSEGEHLTLETAEILVRRLNKEGATWGQPVLLPDRVGRGIDCEALDTEGSRRLLKVQVTRPRMPDGFWKGITEGSSVPPGPVNEAARGLWDAVVDKSPPASRGSSSLSTQSAPPGSLSRASLRRTVRRMARRRRATAGRRSGSSATTRPSRDASTERQPRRPDPRPAP